MELKTLKPTNIIKAEEVEIIPSDDFIKANTTRVQLNHLIDDSIIPVFAKDNESTISHQDFIETAYKVTDFVFSGEKILEPTIKVSHPIKGRIPEAKHKSPKELLDHEKTLYYERMAFLIDIPSITNNISGNKISLTIGGVRAYNHENLYSKKSEERFKVFIGFKNWVCTNLCISTDGIITDMRVRSVEELGKGIIALLRKFNIEQELVSLANLKNYSITENQFAQLIGKSKMYQYLPLKQKKELFEFPLVDSQVSTITKDYYRDESFCRNTNGYINLWKLYNLFTSANKSSYIDTFLERGKNCSEFINIIAKNVENKQFWYLN